MRTKFGLWTWSCVMVLASVAAHPPITGDDVKRPYELVWANRVQDLHAPFAPLTDAAGWTVETSHAVATFTRATDRLLFGDGVCRLTYRATGANPVVTLRPPQPIPVNGPFDTVSCWGYGNNHNGYAPDPSTPSVTVTAHFADVDGRSFAVKLLYVNYKEWFQGWARLSPDQIARTARGATFTSLMVTGGTNAEDRSIDLNSLCAFTEAFKPLSFAPRAKRPNRVFPDAPPGNNVGTGLLPFPNTPLGVVPKTRPAAELEIALPQRASNWDDLAFRWKGGAWQRVATDGGLWFADLPAGPDKSRGASRRRVETGTAVVTNRVAPLDVTVTGRLEPSGDVVRTRFHVEGRSLVVDVATDAKDIREVRFGAWASPPADVQFVRLPYYSYGNWGTAERPGVLAAELGGGPFFHAATLDWTQSNASEPVGGSMRWDGALAANGGVLYGEKTDGTRNVCRERFVYTFSDAFADVLPNVPNPPSPWRHVTGTGVWRAHGAGNRERDKAYWRGVRARGLKHVIVTDHETCWRDGDESFTFRTDPAPKKGGDKGLYDYARVMIDELGFVYGPYNNFTDFAPVNANWHPDRVARHPDMRMQTAWVRCYAPKSAYAVEACAAFTPINQRKFGFNTAYCDVHTAVTPWSRTDYDARVPGAGTFAATFYAYGEIMLIQRTNWRGPVYSEGGVHWMYCGLTDGNYAQDQSYNISINPWLVDFDLRRLHPLACNFGMGDVGMFYPGKSAPTNADVKVDRFLAATVAFGHPGYLVPSPKMEDRSYFMIQALAARYTQADVAEIRYLDADGTAYETSRAVLNGVFHRSQVAVTYADGTFVAANGSTTEPMKLECGIELPPNGYCGWTADGGVFVYSGLVDGHRVDYSVSPEYVYMDGRGVATKLPGGSCTGAVVRLREKDTGVWPSPTVADFVSRSRAPAGTYVSAAPAVEQPTLPSLFCVAMQRRGRSVEAVDRTAGAFAGKGGLASGGVWKNGLTMHPPYREGAGRVFAQYRLTLPKRPVAFRAVVGKGDGSDLGDGIFYSVVVEDADGTSKDVASVHVAKHAWLPIEADLSPWAGRRIKLSLVADCGPSDNTAGDWAAWADLKLDFLK